MSSRWRWLMTAVGVTSVLAGSPYTPESTFVDTSAAPGPARRLSRTVESTEHRYRIVGKVRLLLFWVSSDDDVGGARITWKRDEGDCATISLLIGSDPARAPRRINEWGYIRERICGDTADAFGVRTMTDADSVEDAKVRIALEQNAALYGAMCSTTNRHNTVAAATTIQIPRDVTYHRFGRLLDALGTASRWDLRRVSRPADAAPGFLSALDQLIHSTNQAKTLPARAPAPALSYLYREWLYDLRVNHIARLSEVRVGSVLYRRVMRTEFSLRNRGTGHTERFVLTYPREGPLANVPVLATYQPNRWFKIELRLDDALSLPDDPDSSETVATRINDLCARQTAALEHPAVRQR